MGLPSLPILLIIAAALSVIAVACCGVIPTLAVFAATAL
jgi:hypothetical protein